MPYLYWGPLFSHEPHNHEFGGIDTILGVNWMELYHVSVNVASRTTTITVPGDEMLTYHYEEVDKKQMGYIVVVAQLDDGKK